jgi:hypothetical protein
LEVIDMRSTLIESLPPAMCQLRKLYELDWRQTPLQKFLEEENGLEFGDLRGVMDMLVYQFSRANLKDALTESLLGEHFARDIDKPNIKQRILGVVELAYSTFTDLEEMKIFVRRVDKLLPHAIDEVHDGSMLEAREAFHKLRDDTTRQRLAADVEIKLRGVYYDMCEKSRIEEMIRGIYENVTSLEDVQFLVKYTRQVMPEKPEDVTGEGVWASILQLQGDLIAKRDGSVGSLCNAISQLYPEQTQEALEAKTQEIAVFYQKERFATKKELDNMSQLTAEVSKLFPPDFMSVVPAEIIERAAQKFGRTKTAGGAKTAATTAAGTRKGH